MPFVVAAAALFFSLLTRAVVERVETSTVRWRVKTCTDRASNAIDPAHAQWTTVREQSGLDAPPITSNTPRLRQEQTVYQLDGYLLATKHEIDGDYHLVIRDPEIRATIIAEIPDPQREEVRGSRFADSYANARAVIDRIAGAPSRSVAIIDHPIRSRLSGVGFFDEPHAVEQEGASRNSREIHPVLKIEPLTNDPLIK